jgi:hypothetical protein
MNCHVATQAARPERDWVSIEAVVEGFAIAARSWGRLTQGSAGTAGEGGAPWERAVFACRGMPESQLAVLLWCNGIEDDTVHGAVLHAMMGAAQDLEGRLKARPHGRWWPKGMVSALANLAVYELRPRIQMQNPRLTDTERRALIARTWPKLPTRNHPSWIEEWRPRYLDILQAGRKLEWEAGEWIRRNCN